MSVYALNSTAITVQWGPVDCSDRNGNITGYSVRYGEVGSAERERTVDEMVSGDFSGGMHTISGLIGATVYTVEVAAKTSAGSGLYSEPVNIETPDSECAVIHIMSLYTAPPSSVDVFLSLNGRVIPNHGYVVISDIGTAGDDTALLCITNRPPPTGSPHSGGDWFAPDGTRVTVDGTAVPGFRRNRGPMVVRLYRNTATGPPAEGIYYCQINDVSTLQTVTVAIYNSSEGIYIMQKILCMNCACSFIDIEAVTVSDVILFLLRANIFDLTCISTGGPATTVTWTRDSVTVTERAVTHYYTSNQEYAHTLTVTGRLEGLYTCTVANDKPSSDSANITVQGNIDQVIILPNNNISVCSSLSSY